MRRAFRLGIGANAEREVEDELAFHLAMRAQRLIEQGLSPEDARTEAVRQFGDVAAVRRSCVTFDEERDRAMRRADLLDELRQDFVFALRMLRRNAGVMTVVVLSLALGIGANTAIFTLVDAVLLRPLAVRQPERLVALGDPARINSLSQGTQRADLFSYPLYRDLRDHNRFVSGLVASGSPGRLDVGVDAGATGVEHPRARLVSGNYFAVLGLPAQAGRVFGGTEDGPPGTANVVVISDGYWSRRFNRSSSAIGRVLTINGAGFTIVGVGPPSYAGEIVGVAYDLWIPANMQAVLRPRQAMLDDRFSSWLLLLGRLAEGVTMEQAVSGLGAQVRELMVANARAPGAAQQLRTGPVWIASGARGFSRVRFLFGASLIALMVGVALLMLIICANVANLLLARAVARSREMGVRIAIGAGRSRLLRQCSRKACCSR